MTDKVRIDTLDANLQTLPTKPIWHDRLNSNRMSEVTRANYRSL
ncbi:Uncharacterised protein [Cedecea neteri]|uniref:Uncharacterized protein n=1 Tax=Cedecea neteri TaxID=158822 RepID=A0A2X2V8Z5_9ENTR|nr:Uncharacterised protein [Cedecea neteri]